MPFVAAPTRVSAVHVVVGSVDVRVVGTTVVVTVPHAVLRPAHSTMPGAGQMIPGAEGVVRAHILAIFRAAIIGIASFMVGFSARVDPDGPRSPAVQTTRNPGHLAQRKGIRFTLAFRARLISH